MREVQKRQNTGEREYRREGKERERVREGREVSVEVWGRVMARGRVDV